MKRIYQIFFLALLLTLAGCNFFKNFNSPEPPPPLAPDAHETQRVTSPSRTSSSIRRAPQARTRSSAERPVHASAAGGDHAQIGKTTCYSKNAAAGGGVWRATALNRSTAAGAAMQKCEQNSRDKKACQLSGCNSN